MRRSSLWFLFLLGCVSFVSAGVGDWLFASTEEALNSFFLAIQIFIVNFENWVVILAFILFWLVFVMLCVGVVLSPIFVVNYKAKLEKLYGGKGSSGLGGLIKRNVRDLVKFFSDDD